jgi:hypothetical protein
MKTPILPCLDTICEISPLTQLVQISAIRVNFFFKTSPLLSMKREMSL